MGYGRVVDWQGTCDGMWGILGTRRRIPSFGEGTLKERYVLQLVGMVRFFFALESNKDGMNTV